MTSKNHYYTTKVVKMGKWSALPLDAESWYGNKSSEYFRKQFGIYKGLLCLYSSEFIHCYVPEELLKNLNQQIIQINRKNFKSLEGKLKDFYPLVKKAKTAITPKTVIDYSKLSNKKIIDKFLFIRDWVRRITIFDQFGFIGENYLTTTLEDILVNKLCLLKNSEEYNKTLFILTKPEEISTTLSEKRFVLQQAIEIKNKKTSLEKASKKLAKAYGWMPVFCYGDPWDNIYYQKELKMLSKKSLGQLENEYIKLKSYKKLRNKNIKSIILKYKISPQDLQKFIDFGLALDTRNEAEYFVSYAGFQLLPLYKEIAKRLYISINQTRLLYETEIVDCLLREKDAGKFLELNGKFRGFGYNKIMSKRFNFSGGEVTKLFSHIERRANSIQGDNEQQGVCASPGKTQGFVRIISSPEQNDRVNDGDILITYATTVDYLPAMKKAAAIITEVGGLTCHAAVISREFGIPCIVAVKNAMKNFKDGDLVEVDANRGMVKILKKT